MPYADLRTAVLEAAIRNGAFIRLEALLTLDDEKPVELFPLLGRSVEQIKARQAAGDISEDIDPVALHLVSSSMYLGYAVFREQMALESGTTTDDLDRRVVDTFRRVFRAVVASSE